jgi:hypothetical protein
MYAVLPSIDVHPMVADAYRAATQAPIGAYRSDTVDVMSPDEVRWLLSEALARPPVDALPGA